MSEELIEYETNLVDKADIKEVWSLQRNASLGMAALMTVYLIAMWQSPFPGVGRTFDQMITDSIKLDMTDTDVTTLLRNVAQFVAFRCIAIGIPFGVAASLLSEGLQTPTKPGAQMRKLAAYTSQAFTAITGFTVAGATASLIYLVSAEAFVWFVCSVGAILVYFVAAGTIFELVSKRRKKDVAKPAEQ